MFSTPDAAIIVASILTAGATSIVGLMQFGPRSRAGEGESCADEQRLAALESRMAVSEANNLNLVKMLDSIQREMHELRDLMLELVGRK